MRIMGAVAFAGGICAAATACGGREMEVDEHARAGTVLLGTPSTLANNQPRPNPSGSSATFTTNGSIDLNNEFFQDLGTNGRRCATCHQIDQGWTVSPPQLHERFEATGGTDPIFRPNDGSNSPNADVSTVEARRSAYSQLLTKGVIRIGIGLAPTAEMELIAVDDPYHFASAAELSLFRRPLPTTNLRFLSAIMWDGRETFAGQTIAFGLADQANGATIGHAQGAPLTAAQRAAIVAFETALTTAQVFDHGSGELQARRARGGHAALSQQSFYIGINDLFGDSQTHAPFEPVVFDIYDAWTNLGPAGDDGRNASRAAVARGEALFNTRPIEITGVGGINDEAIFGNPAIVHGTCTTCHDSPNVGNHSVVAPLDIGIADGSRRTPDMPLYTLRNKTTGQVRQTTDPGRALVTGRWKDIGRFKGPILRGLAARAPYFHNGSSATLAAVIEFYDDRFLLALTASEKADLEAFLRAL